MSKGGSLCLKINHQREKITFAAKKYTYYESSIPQKCHSEFLPNLQMKGIDVDKNAVQRIESGERFVTDIELKALAETFKTSCDELLEE